jgi:hypothetical protein
MSPYLIAQSMKEKHFSVAETLMHIRQEKLETKSGCCNVIDVYGTRAFAQKEGKKIPLIFSSSYTSSTTGTMTEKQ